MRALVVMMSPLGRNPVCDHLLAEILRRLPFAGFEHKPHDRRVVDRVYALRGATVEDGGRLVCARPGAYRRNRGQARIAPAGDRRARAGSRLRGVISAIRDQAHPGEEHHIGLARAVC
jgi:hypothetical protein